MITSEVLTNGSCSSGPLLIIALVMPLLVWKVYPDGRPDELVRGVDIVGTPLLSLNNIILTGDKLQVFNGVCGAESGQVPVSAAAPAMLFSEIEVQKKNKGTDRPPLMPPPGADQSSAQKSAPVTEGSAVKARPKSGSQDAAKAKP